MCRLPKAEGRILILLILLFLSATLQRDLVGQKGEKQKPSRELPAPVLVARATTRIDKNLEELRVYRGGRLVVLGPFHELVAVTPAAHGENLEYLVGKSVTLIRSLEDEGQWEIYTGVGAAGELTLAGNIFKVRQVVLSGPDKAIEVRVNGQTHRLGPGQALIALR